MRRLDLVSRDVRSLTLGADPVDYVLVRRRGRRGVGLKVDETGLTVSAPSTMSLARIEALVRESERWVLRKLAEWSERQVPVVAWGEGVELPFLGETLRVSLRLGARSRCDRDGAHLHVIARSPAAEDVRRPVVAWYRRFAGDYLERRVRELAIAAGIAMPKLFLSSAMARWGSCNSRREVRLAWRLIKAPPAMVDYVICHELAHLRHMNHSPDFWAEVERQCPDYRRLRAALFATDHLYRAF